MSVVATDQERPADQDRPIAYQAVAMDLRQALAAGEYSNGRPLPTEAALAAQYDVSRQTVRRAMHDLVAEGLVFRVRGRGTFATPIATGAQYLRSVGSIEDLLALSEDTDLETLQPFTRRADVGAASRLHLPTDQVYAAVVRRLHQGVPFCLTQIFLSTVIGQKIVDRRGIPERGKLKRVTVISLIDEVATQPVVGAHQSITACLPPVDVAAQIDVPLDAPVLRIDRLYIDAAGVPVELAISYFNPERYSYRLDLRRSIRTGTAGRG